MWEAIAANRRRSILLIALMGIILMTLGAAIGMFVASNAHSFRPWAPEPEDTILLGALYGAAGAALLWLALWMFAVYGGEKLMLRSVHARRIVKSDSPRLWNTVEEMSLASGLAQMPRVYLVEDPAPNAFAVGRKPEHSAVAVTSGLLRLLNRDELQGVVAHEIGHIHNLDIRFMTIAAVLVGSVELLSRSVLQVGAHASHGRRSGGGGRSNKGAGALLALVFLLAVVSPLLAQLLYLACSRQREYLADASAARFTRYPEGLASALEKIAVHQSGYKVENVNRAVAALCIINPLEHLKLSNVVSTHPPTGARIKILRGMGGGAGYVDYEAAWKRIQGRKARLVALEAAARSGGRLAARGPSTEPEAEPSAVDRAREVADLIDRFVNYLLIPCACGMRIKVPPEYHREAVECPRCSRLNALPMAVPAGAAGTNVPETAVAPEAQLPSVESAGGTLQYERRSQDWDGFRCTCGQTIQLGPDFPLDYTICANCNRRIEIRKVRCATE